MKKFLQALSVGIVFLVVCGFIYPLLVMGIGQAAFPYQANGSLVKLNGQVVGSALIGQNFSDDRFFHGRVSAVNYNTFAANEKAENMKPGSGSENLAVSNQALVERIKRDVQAFLKANPSVSEKDLPADLFTSSFSGLDPDISPAAASVQADRIAAATGIGKDKIEGIIQDATAGPELGVFGETRVNVLKANLEIYQLLHS